ncbi:MAG: NAD-dependent epimerase/dehydratase family protein [Planctomycetaceae bacterium]|nr:NAD-dependent epimerase/dehydratase family protein [Planctomycetaceae bacterium]
MTSSQQTSRLIAGCGYLGLRAAQYWVSSGDSVSAITRSTERAESFRRCGLTPLLGQLAADGLPGRLPAAETVLWAVGFDRTSGDSRQAVWIDGLTRFVSQLSSAPQRFLYVSSTSVYGDQVGTAIDESTEPAPQTEGGECCLQAEIRLRQLVAQRFPSTQVCVLRMAGIYGPNRLLRRVEDLREKKPLPGDGEQWLNLIHVDDAVTAVAHMAAAEGVPDLMNVVNSGTLTRAAYYERLAHLAKAPAPVFGGPANGRPRGGNKRVVSQYAGTLSYQFDDVSEGLSDAWQRSEKCPAD